MPESQKNLYVLTVYPDETHTNGVRFILDVFGREAVEALQWWVEFLDCTGHKAQAFCDKVNKNRGLLISGRELLQQSTHFEQVIEGTFIGFQDTVSDPASVLQHFPTAPSPIAIVVIENVCCDVYLRDAAFKSRLEANFPKVIEQDTAHYFTSRGVQDTD